MIRTIKSNQISNNSIASNITQLDILGNKSELLASAIITDVNITSSAASININSIKIEFINSGTIESIVILDSDNDVLFKLFIGTDFIINPIVNKGDSLVFDEIIIM